MEERLNYLIDLLIEKDKVIAQLQKYYAETANSYDELKKATDGETVSELKEEIHNLKLRIKCLDSQNDDLQKENESLKNNKEAKILREENKTLHKRLDELTKENHHSDTPTEKQEQSDFYFETYNAAKDYLTRIYGNEASKLRTERDVEAFFIRHGKKLIIKNND